MSDSERGGGLVKDDDSLLEGVGEMAIEAGRVNGEPVVVFMATGMPEEYRAAMSLRRPHVSHLRDWLSAWLRHTEAES